MTKYFKRLSPQYRREQEAKERETKEQEAREQEAREQEVEKRETEKQKMAQEKYKKDTDGLSKKHRQDLGLVVSDIAVFNSLFKNNLVDAPSLVDDFISKKKSRDKTKEQKFGAEKPRIRNVIKTDASTVVMSPKTLIGSLIVAGDFDNLERLSRHFNFKEELSAREDDSTEEIGTSPHLIIHYLQTAKQVNYLLDKSGDVGQLQFGQSYLSTLFTGFGTKKWSTDNLEQSKAKFEIARTLIDRGVDIGIPKDQGGALGVLASSLLKNGIKIINSGNLDIVVEATSFMKEMVSKGAVVDDKVKNLVNLLKEQREILVSTRGDKEAIKSIDKALKNLKGVLSLTPKKTALNKDDKKGPINSDLDRAKPASLEEAIKAGNDEAIKDFIKKTGAKNLTKPDKNGQTALHLMMQNGSSMELVKEFLDKLEKNLLPEEFAKFLNAKDAQGNAAVHYAAENGYSGFIKILSGKGADLLILNSDGATPANIATAEKCSKCRAVIDEEVVLGEFRKKLTSLVNKGADYEKEIKPLLLKADTLSVNESDVNGSPILHLFIERGYPLEDLVARGDIDFNTKNKDGETALHLASKYGMDRVVKLLVSKGSSLDVTNNNGQTPAQLVGVESPSPEAKAITEAAFSEIQAQKIEEKKAGSRPEVDVKAVVVPERKVEVKAELNEEPEKPEVKKGPQPASKIPGPEKESKESKGEKTEAVTPPIERVESNQEQSVDKVPEVAPAAVSAALKPEAPKISTSASSQTSESNPASNNSEKSWVKKVGGPKNKEGHVAKMAAKFEALAKGNNDGGRQ